MPETIKVAIFEDSRHLRESLQIVLNGSPGFTCVGAYPDCKNILAQVEKDKPGIILMDIEMPGTNGIEATALVKSTFPQVHVLIQTIFFEDDYIFRGICAGASGYILKSTSFTGYLDALSEVFSGGSPMTPGIARRVLELFKQHAPAAPAAPADYQLTSKEKEILKLLVNGRSYKMIAAEMNVSFETVKSHIRNIYQKLQVNSNTEAVALALGNRLV